jgi:glycosyltransferase involved in cell wall biosynthesis
VIIINELGGAQWTGGITYRNNLLKAIKLLNRQHEVVCLVSNPEISDLDNDFKVLKIKSNKNIIEVLIGKLLKSLFYFDYSIYRTIRSVNPDILFPHSFKVGSNTSLIYWIPDFQFLHLPQFYPPNYIELNRNKLSRYFERAKIIVVSSEDALSDLRKFLPKYSSKVRVMRFVAHIPENLYQENPLEIAKLYHLPEDFVFMPNQFWSHKNHLGVFEALKLLKDDGIMPYIVCTGNPVDVRNPSYLAKLLQKISELGIRDQVAFLGLLPHNHVYSLIRQSKCVLNPSHFEGWSTSVEEAKSVGKRMLLSNLNVHIEQDPPNSLYFEKDSIVDLADKLKKAWIEFTSGPDEMLESMAKASIENRMRIFANTFFEICEEASKIQD